MRLGSYFTGGITPGTVRALKALVPDSNKDLSGLRNLTVTGDISPATWGGVTAGTLTASKPVILNSSKKLLAGTGSASFSLDGAISINVTTLGSSATNTTQTLMSYSLPANTLDTNTAGVKVKAFGRFAGNAAPKTMQLNFGGASINAGSVTQSGSTWFMEFEAYRVASNSQRIIFRQNIGGVVVVPKSTTDTSVDTGAITISVQCLDASATQSNVLQDGLVVEFISS